MKEKELRRSNGQKILLRQTYYLLQFEFHVIVTTKFRATTLFPFTVNYLREQNNVVR